jgi:hypothetical protein
MFVSLAKKFPARLSFVFSGARFGSRHFHGLVARR